MGPRTYISLFSGAGGGDLACQWLLGWQCVCYVEIDDYCQRVLKQRIKDGLLDDAPIWDDARTFDGRPWRGRVDCVTTGFPCQPFSVAGKRRGEDDERNMWPATIECIRVVRPQWALLENVPGLLVHEYFGTILGDLAESGMDARWRVLSAAHCGASHIRERVFVLAHAGSLGRISRQAKAIQPEAGLLSKDHGPLSREAWLPGVNRRTCRLGRYLPDDGDYAVVDGLATKLDELRALGNGQVPLVAATAWRLLTR